jgi:hypothetical protein
MYSEDGPPIYLSPVKGVLNGPNEQECDMSVQSSVQNDEPIDREIKLEGGDVLYIDATGSGKLAHLYSS